MRISDQSRRDVMFGLLTLLLVGVISLSFPGFAAPQNLAEVLNDTALLMLLALGQMLVIITRGIDLSVAANLALTGMIVALVNRSMPDANMFVIIAVAAISGALLGAFNGLLVWKLRLPAIVVTLGTMSIYRGVIFLLSKGAWVNDHELSPAFLGLVRSHFLGLSFLSWFAIIAAFVAWLILRYTRMGRNFFAAGDNPNAAQYSGIDPGRMQFIAYVICGAIAGLCGYLWVARFAVAYTDIALGFELQVIAACLIGGVAIAGGIGSVAGVLLGCLFVGIVKNALPLIGVSAFWQMSINGIVILVAVILNARQAAHHQAGRRATLETAPL